MKYAQKKNLIVIFNNIILKSYLNSKSFFEFEMKLPAASGRGISANRTSNIMTFVNIVAHRLYYITKIDYAPRGGELYPEKIKTLTQKIYMLFLSQ